MSQKQFLIQSLKRKGFSKPILQAFSKVKREDFIPKELKNHAYEDTPLPIGKGQTISQPYTIAIMLSLLELKKGQKVLEVGSGCGYALSLLSELVGVKGRVFGIEIVKSLFEKSKKNLKDYRNVKIYNKDGSLGLKEESLFDRILISAGSQEIPKPLIRQLKTGGILVAPIGYSHGQSLIVFEKLNRGLVIKEEIPGFIFVPLVKG